MPLVSRVLDPSPTADLEEYRRDGGGGALAAARAVEPEALVATVEAAGLRGRGGAGFPTGTKWRTVAAMGRRSAATVVVNGAEGEPGTFKDRAILRANPYRVLEGALIAALAVGADRGAELVDGAGETAARPTLVDNVETLANVPFVVGLGPDAYREVGTAESPGTIVCTVSGRTERAGVVEVAMGTTLGEVLALGGGAPLGHRIVAVLSGTAQPLLPGSALDAPVSWEGLAAAGGGLGSAGFIVIDDEVDVVAVAAGVSLFLSVESCGQCTPCKQDGMALTDTLVRIAAGAGRSDDLDRLATLTSTVATGARCYLATQHEQVVASLLAQFPDAVAEHLSGRAAPPEPYPIAPIADLVDGVVVLDASVLELAPDWGTGTGAAPADAIDTRRAS